MSVETFRCPDSPDPAGIVGCGRTFQADRDQDPDRWVDCPHCGIFFDPDNPNNSPAEANA